MHDFFNEDVIISLARQLKWHLHKHY